MCYSSTYLGLHHLQTEQAVLVLLELVEELLSPESTDRRLQLTLNVRAKADQDLHYPSLASLSTGGVLSAHDI